MLRIVYCQPLAGYATFDGESACTLIAYQGNLYDQFLPVICIVDYNKKLIFNKSGDYKHHRDLIDHLIFDPKYVSQY